MIVANRERRGGRGKLVMDCMDELEAGDETGRKSKDRQERGYTQTTIEKGGGRGGCPRGP